MGNISYEDYVIMKSKILIAYLNELFNIEKAIDNSMKRNDEVEFQIKAFELLRKKIVEEIAKFRSEKEAYQNYYHNRLENLISQRIELGKTINKTRGSIINLDPLLDCEAQIKENIINILKQLNISLEKNFIFNANSSMIFDAIAEKMAFLTSLIEVEVDSNNCKFPIRLKK